MQHPPDRLQEVIRETNRPLNSSDLPDDLRLQALEVRMQLTIASGAEPDEQDLERANQSHRLAMQAPERSRQSSMLIQEAALLLRQQNPRLTAILALLDQACETIRLSSDPALITHVHRQACCIWRAIPAGAPAIMQLRRTLRMLRELASIGYPGTVMTSCIRTLRLELQNLAASQTADPRQPPKKVRRAGQTRFHQHARAFTVEVKRRIKELRLMEHPLQPV